MKKLVGLVMSATLMFSLAACGQKVDEEALKAELKEELRQEMASEVMNQETEAASAEEVSEKVSEEETTQATEGAKGKTGSVSETDWKSMTFALDGKKLTIPFDYSEIKDSWTVDMKEYGYEDGYIMNKGDKTYSTIELTNSKFEEPIQVGFQNYDDSSKDILECKIWSIDMTTVNKPSYPNIELPGGITWGSTLEEVVAAYGEVEDPYRAEELGYWSYEYYIDYTYKMRLVIYDDKGLSEITYQLYN